MASTNRARGPMSEWKDADAAVKDICLKLKPDVEKELGTTLTVLDALDFQSQLPGGTFYIIKAYGGVDQLVGLQVFEKSTGVPTLIEAKVEPLPDQFPN